MAHFIASGRLRRRGAQRPFAGNEFGIKIALVSGPEQAAAAATSAYLYRTSRSLYASGIPRDLRFHMLVVNSSEAP